MYQVVSGTHRAHAARIWSFPYVLGRVHTGQLPAPLRPHTRELAALWDGLRQRGLFAAETSGECWYLHTIVAEWMLAPPPLATQMNAAYERSYPGALQDATGLTVSQLIEPQRWAEARVGA